MDKDRKVMFTLEGEEEKTEFYVIADTYFNNTAYILVTDAKEDEDGEAFILKEVRTDPTLTTVTYEVVDDDRELNAVGGIFAEILEEQDIELG
ncbi:MAG: DUF1292 domain-containing protein [Lachnospiraceae bacterium]|nr:DUF1292 domain-containing protein [Lachnospiraceae bacterium]